MLVAPPLDRGLLSIIENVFEPAFGDWNVCGFNGSGYGSVLTTRKIAVPSSVRVLKNHQFRPVLVFNGSKIAKTRHKKKKYISIRTLGWANKPTFLTRYV